MKKSFVVLFAILILPGIWLTRHQWLPKPALPDSSAKSEALASSYWTCPMHPQIHSDKAGECPICHMKLVQVKAQNNNTTITETATEQRAEISVSPAELKNLGIQKYQVQRMDLNFHIPVSGRFLSSSSVAFQVFESDLRWVKSGLRFKGESSLFPESELIGTITSVDSVIDPTSRTVRVLGSLQKAPHGLLAETTFSGEVQVVIKNAIVIPESSVLHTGTGAIVYTIQSDNKLTAVLVSLGLKSESYYQVLSGVEVDQWISAGPNFLIDSEAKLRGTSGHSNH